MGRKGEGEDAMGGDLSSLPTVLSIGRKRALRATDSDGGNIEERGGGGKALCQEKGGGTPILHRPILKG